MEPDDEISDFFYMSELSNSWKINTYGVKKLQV